MLADLGADVVKVESRDGDPLRRMGQQRVGPVGAVGAGRAQQALHRARPRRRAGATTATIFRRLVAASDVLVENLPAETRTRWGCTYDDLAALNPSLVVVSVSCYGRSGPYAERPGAGTLAEAFAGLTADDRRGRRTTDARVGGDRRHRHRVRRCHRCARRVLVARRAWRHRAARRREHVRADPRDHGGHRSPGGTERARHRVAAGVASPVVRRATSIGRATTATSPCPAPPIRRSRACSSSSGTTSPEDRARFGARRRSCAQRRRSRRARRQAGSPRATVPTSSTRCSRHGSA